MLPRCAIPGRHISPGYAAENQVLSHQFDYTRCHDWPGRLSFFCFATGMRGKGRSWNYKLTRYDGVFTAGM